MKLLINILGVVFALCLITFFLWLLCIDIPKGQEIYRKHTDQCTKICFPQQVMQCNQQDVYCAVTETEIKVIKIK